MAMRKKRSEYNNCHGRSGADPGFLISGGADLEKKVGGNKKSKKVKKLCVSHQHTLPPPLGDFRSGFLRN